MRIIYIDQSQHQLLSQTRRDVAQLIRNGVIDFDDARVIMRKEVFRQIVTLQPNPAYL